MARDLGPERPKGNGPCAHGTMARPKRLIQAGCTTRRRMMGKGLLLWLVGVPIPVIIILWLIFGH
ncbi:ABC transporter permease [Sphingobium sufflavum]|uniref:ABC transporter permease n=1 Tax=Sphingobium sufflavum TaxID=1129547 RepID=UPI001F47E3E8|nr:ABC transporter permease [Sphingobium sufflavum]MCE7795530.1 ABC transporter permease [Sphingobium sufflavum]